MTKNDDEILRQLESIRNELKEGRKQTASSLVLEPERKAPSLGSFLKIGFKKWSVKLILFLLVLLIVGTIIGLGISYFFSDAKAETEKGSFIEQMKDLSTLATSQAYVKAVIEKENNEIFGKEISVDIPGTKQKVLLIVPGSVTAGVDLQSIKERDVKINEEEKSMEITLPRAEIIQEPSLDFEQVQTFSVEGVFRKEVDWEKGYDLASEAQELVKKEALEQGILQMAENNAEKTLKEFFSQMGYQVTVHFGGKGSPKDEAKQ
jgi:hypothetical protein